MKRVWMCSIAVMALTALAPVFGDEVRWSEPVIADYRDDAVVTYRARVAGDYLLIEATHAADWHTYSMDNVLRARERSGNESPETELPTRITVEGGLEIDGAWYQSPPRDLSQEDIKWFTWGFEGAARFAVKVRSVSSEDARIVIDGQACNASRCRMVDRLALEFDPASVRSEDLPELDEFVEVVAESESATE